MRETVKNIFVTDLIFGRSRKPASQFFKHAHDKDPHFQTSAVHYSDVIMSVTQITSLTTVYSDVDQRKHQSSVPLVSVRGIQR